eukprot:SAG31_NODE_45779_length_257_cov_0.968354_1_plen_31_part_10
MSAAGTKSTPARRAELCAVGTGRRTKPRNGS